MRSTKEGAESSTSLYKRPQTPSLSFLFLTHYQFSRHITSIQYFNHTLRVFNISIRILDLHPPARQRYILYQKGKTASRCEEPHSRLYQMYFSKSIATAVVAALPVILGSPILDTRQNGVTCQTSSGSPKTGDVTDVINQLKGQGGDCSNTNGEGSGTIFGPTSR